MDAADWLVVSIGAVAAVAAVDRVLARRGAPAGPIVRRKRPAWERRRGGASGMLGDLIEVFQPSHRHLVEESDRRRGEIRQAGTAAPGVDVDLEGGVATFPGDPGVNEREQRRRELGRHDHEL